MSCCKTFFDNGTSEIFGRWEKKRAKRNKFVYLFSCGYSWNKYFKKNFLLLLPELPFKTAKYAAASTGKAFENNSKIINVIKEQCRNVRKSCNCILVIVDFSLRNLLCFCLRRTVEYSILKCVIWMWNRQYIFFCFSFLLHSFRKS